MLTEAIAAFLFTLEWYHIWGHSVILFRIRLLPMKDLVRIRLYFLIDLLTVLSSCLFTGKLRWLAALQMTQHAYYFLFWNQTNPAKKIIAWSSLDWVTSDFRDRWQLDSIIGTSFDVGVHLGMAYYLGQYLNTWQVICSLVVVQAGVFYFLFGPYYAWANPNKIPPWIQKRIHIDKIPKLEN